MPQALDLNYLRARSLVLRNGIHAELTQRGYGYDWSAFEKWAKEVGVQTLPASAEIVELYVTGMIERGCKVSTASRHVSAINYQHRRAGLVSPITPEVRLLLDGARRLTGARTRKMKPLSLEGLREVSVKLVEIGDARAIRDRAILLLGYASALRRSSIAALTLDDIEAEPGRVRVYISREKQDQQRRGRYVGVPAATAAELCPVAALDAWLAVRGAHPGALFTRVMRRPESRHMRPAVIWLIVRRRLRDAGIDADGYGAHSLRSGFITEAGEGGVPDLVIAAHTGHRSLQVVREYFRPNNVWKANAAALIGL